MLRLTNARLADGRLVDVDVDVNVDIDVDPGRGHIIGVNAVGTAPLPEGSAVDDLAGFLLLPALGEPHAHLDKALTAERVPNPTGDLAGAISAWNTAAARGDFPREDLVARAGRALELLLLNGVTAVRTHVNVGAGIGTSWIEAMLEVRDAFAGLVDLQIVALTHSPMTGTDGAGNRAALVAAVAAGAHLVGGCPHLDPDGPALIANALAVATDAGIGIDLHVDETLDPTVLTLRELARQVQASGFAHPVTASHCVSLGVQPPAVQAAVASEVAAARIAVVTLPQTNLFLQGREHAHSTPRGLTALRALLDAGVVVAAGADNVQDPFNLVGRSDPLETATLLVLAAHVMPEFAFAMVSGAVRRVLALPPVSVAAGDPGDLLAINAPSIRGAIADAPADRRVYRAGRLVARTASQSEVRVRSGTGMRTVSSFWPRSG